MATGSQRRTRSERVAALELPPGGWERTWSSLQRGDVLLRIGLGVAVAVLLCAVMHGWEPPFTYRTGYVPASDISARVSFEAIHPAETESARERARRQVRPIYIHDPQPLDRLIAALETAVTDVVAAESFAALNPQTAADFFPMTAEDEARRKFEKMRQALSGDTELTTLRSAIAAALTPFREKGVLGGSPPRPGQGGIDEIVVYPTGQPETRSIVKYSQVQVGKGTALRETLQRHLRTADLGEPVFTWLERHFTPSFSTLIRDDAQTMKAEEAALAAVENVVMKYQAGQTLAQGGEPLSTDTVRLLRREHAAAMERRATMPNLGRAAAVIALILALFSLSAFYLYRYERRLLLHPNRLAGMLGLVVLTVLLAVWASADAWRAELIPLLLFGQTVAIAYRQELALLLSGVVVLILALGLGLSTATLILLMGVTATAVLQLGRIRSRSKLIYVSLWAAVVAFGLTAVLALVDNQPLGKPLWIGAACNALWTVAAGFLMTGVLPFIENLFGVLTDISLLELGDVSHPLLQQLVQRARALTTTRSPWARSPRPPPNRSTPGGCWRASGRTTTTSARCSIPNTSSKTRPATETATSRCFRP